MPESRYRILDLCSRINGHPRQYTELRSLCWQYRFWNQLINAAELEGMTPLLNKHLLASTAYVPNSIKRSLFLLLRRHARLTELQTKATGEAIDRLQTAGIPVLLIKGAALRFQLYPDPVLRPMRDIDLLLDPRHADEAQALLRAMGYKQSTAPIPSDHFHLPSLHRTIDNFPICIEIHRGLLPNCPPFFQLPPFEHLLSASVAVIINGQSALTMGPEHTFVYLFHHGIRTPLTYESCRLIHLADIIGFIEKYQMTPVWSRIVSGYPDLIRGLPVLHHLTPWDPDNIAPEIARSPLLRGSFAPAEYTGWPRVRMKESRRRGTSLFDLGRQTFFPSRWWLTVYYGADRWFQRLLVLLIMHPAQIWWWARLYRKLRRG